MTLDKILVPTDFSASSEPALAFAAELARATDASLGIVHVYNPTPYEIPEGMRFSAVVNVDGVIAEFRRLLEDAKRRAEQAGKACARRREPPGSSLFRLDVHRRMRRCYPS
jgi:nucleotide-binding universal stress UspA family protein